MFAGSLNDKFHSFLLIIVFSILFVSISRKGHAHIYDHPSVDPNLKAIVINYLKEESSENDEKYLKSFQGLKVDYFYLDKNKDIPMNDGIKYYFISDIHKKNKNYVDSISAIRKSAKNFKIATSTYLTHLDDKLIGNFTRRSLEQYSRLILSELSRIKFGEFFKNVNENNLNNLELGIYYSLKFLIYSEDYKEFVRFLDKSKKMDIRSRELNYAIKLSQIVKSNLNSNLPKERILLLHFLSNSKEYIHYNEDVLLFEALKLRNKFKLNSELEIKSVESDIADILERKPSAYVVYLLKNLLFQEYAARSMWEMAKQELINISNTVLHADLKEFPEAHFQYQATNFLWNANSTNNKLKLFNRWFSLNELYHEKWNVLRKQLLNSVNLSVSAASRHCANACDLDQDFKQILSRLTSHLQGGKE